MVTNFDSFRKDSDRLNNSMIEGTIMFKVRYNHRRPKIRVLVSHRVRSPTQEGYHH